MPRLIGSRLAERSYKLPRVPSSSFRSWTAVSVSPFGSHQSVHDPTARRATRGQTGARQFVLRRFVPSLRASAMRRLARKFSDQQKYVIIAYCIPKPLFKVSAL